MERPWAVASLVLPWLAFAAQAQPKGTEFTARGNSASAVAVEADRVAPLAGWALLACDAPQRAAVLRRPDGELVLVREGDPFPPPGAPLGVEARASDVALGSIRQVLGDRLAIDLPIPADSGPDAAWIHVAAADGTSRVQYSRHEPPPPEIHERPTSGNSTDGVSRSSSRRPE